MQIWLSRRRLLRSGATAIFGLGGAALLSACGASTVTTASVSVSTATVTQTQAPAKLVTVTQTQAFTVTQAKVQTATVTSVHTATVTQAPAPTPTASGIIGSGAAKKAAVTLRWFSYFNPQDVGRLGNQFLPAFEHSQSGVAVEAMLGPGSIIGSQQKYLTMTAAGDPPDLYGNTRPVTTLAQQGVFTNMSPLISRDKFDTAKYNQALFRYQSLYKGDVYGLPLSVHAEAPAMVYNRDLFQKASVPEPPTKWGDPAWTWEKFLSAARALTVAASPGSLAQAGVDSLAYNVHLPVLWEGNWESPQLDKATCDSAAMVDTYTNYFDLQRKYKVMPGSGLKGPGGGFRGGKVAMSTMGSWEFGTYQTLDTINWGFMPFPKATRSAYAFDPNMGYIAKTSKHVEQTWTFLKWLDNGSYYAFYFNFMPMIAADTTNWTRSFFARKPNARPEVLAESLVVAQPTDPIFLLQGVDDFVSKTIEPALSKAIPGGADVATTLQSVKGPLQTLVQSSPK